MCSMRSDIAKATAGASKSEMWAMMVKNKLEQLFTMKEAREERYGLHASAIIASEADFCYREQLLSLFFKQNQGENLPIKLLKIFSQGNAMHEKWYKLFRQAKIDVAIERTLLLEEYDLSFTIDMILDLFGEEVIGDVKSQSFFIFKKQKGHPSGEKQVNFYLWAYSKYTGKAHKRGFVLVDNKDSQEIKVLPVQFDKAAVMPYIERLKHVQVLKQEFLESRTVPKRKCKSCDTKRAMECNMRDACFNIGIGRVKLNVQKKKREK